MRTDASDGYRGLGSGSAERSASGPLRSLERPAASRESSPSRSQRDSSSKRPGGAALPPATKLAPDGSLTPAWTGPRWPAQESSLESESQRDAKRARGDAVPSRIAKGSERGPGGELTAIARSQGARAQARQADARPAPVANAPKPKKRRERDDAAAPYDPRIGRAGTPAAIAPTYTPAEKRRIAGIEARRREAQDDGDDGGGLVDIVGDISGVNDAADAATKLADGDIDGALLSAALAAPTPFSKAGKMAKEGIESAGESKAKRTVAREAEEAAPAAGRKPAAGAGPKPKPKSAAGPSRWKRSEFEGRRVYQRDDLIDPRRRDHLGRTNVTRMKRGLAPLGPDRKPLNLHHTTQRDDGSLAELAQTFHQRNTKVIHVNTNKIPSGINRRDFNRLKRRYWRNRAQGYDGDPFAAGLAPPSLRGSR